MIGHSRSLKVTVGRMYNLRCGSAAPSVPSQRPQSEEAHDSAADGFTLPTHSVASANIFRGHEDSGQSGECVGLSQIQCSAIAPKF